MARAWRCETSVSVEATKPSRTAESTQTNSATEGQAARVLSEPVSPHPTQTRWATI